MGWAMARYPQRLRLIMQSDSPKAYKPTLQALLMGFMGLRRAAEMAADRAAARALGDIRPVAEGLLYLHGNEVDMRRLKRDEIDGLIDDALLDTFPHRWSFWWSSTIQMKRLPPLHLRIAELATWAKSDEGKQLLAVGTSDARAHRLWQPKLRKRPEQAA